MNNRPCRLRETREQGTDLTHSATCCLLGAPIGTGAGVPGCDTGPAALRAARLGAALARSGRLVTDLGDAAPAPLAAAHHANPAIRNLAETAAWIRGLGAAARAAGEKAALPVFLGGDHSLSAATVPAMAARAAARGRPFFVLWLDAHPDLHTLGSTGSGNLHGTPAAYFTGEADFAPFPPLPARVRPENICMMGIRSVDGAEEARLAASGIGLHRMEALHRDGVEAPLEAFLGRVADAGGDLHVSFDIDFLDPAIAPAVGTTVPGGATLLQADAIAAMLGDSGLVTSLDLVELNPTLDPFGRSAALFADLAGAMLRRRETLSRTGS